MSKVTFQDSRIAEIAIVITGDKIELKANRKRSNDSFLRWIERKCDFVKVFATRDAAMNAALKCCPVFHGTHGPVSEIQTAQYVYGIGYCGI